MQVAEHEKDKDRGQRREPSPSGFGVLLPPMQPSPPTPAQLSEPSSLCVRSESPPPLPPCLDEPDVVAADVGTKEDKASAAAAAATDTKQAGSPAERTAATSSSDVGMAGGLAGDSKDAKLADAAMSDIEAKAPADQLFATDNLPLAVCQAFCFA
jgi:hypothetical protein